MNNLKVVTTCPFGHTCIEGKADGTIHRCMLYMDIKGQNPNTGEESTESNCALVWQVMMQMDTTRKVSGVQEATESFRNEMVKSSEQSQLTLVSALAIAQQNIQLGN